MAKQVMTKEEAHNYLYSLWESGEIPSNFTEDHSEYSTALLDVMKNGPDIIWEYF